MGTRRRLLPCWKISWKVIVFFCGDSIQRELQKAVLKLPERQRLVFNMKYFDDMKYEDIAEVLDVAVGTLKATYHNAVKKIEESLKISDTLPSFE